MSGAGGFGDFGAAVGGGTATAAAGFYDPLGVSRPRAGVTEPMSPSTSSSDVGDSFARAPPPVMRRQASGDVPATVEGLQTLARQGSWRGVLDKVKSWRGSHASSPLPPHLSLSFSAYNALALAKLRMLGAAVEEIRAMGDLDGTQTGSLVPFALRWLAAELPHRMAGGGGKQQQSVGVGVGVGVGDGVVDAGSPFANTLDRLYALLDSCVRNVDSYQAQVGEQTTTSSFASGDDANDAVFWQPDIATSSSQVLLGRWRARQEIVVYSILNHHLSQKQYAVALQWLVWLIKRKRGRANGSSSAAAPVDPFLVSKLGAVQLQMGDADRAKEAFAWAERAAAGRNDASVQAQLALNRGLLHFAAKNYAAAVTQFDAVMQHQRPANALAAVCLMHSKNARGAIQVLEESLATSPSTHLSETLVLNLCCMYELAAASPVDAKRALAGWLTRGAPDDFDISCTRL
eukprot:jgi/Chlat1/6480/Chrsp45S06057